MSEEKRFGICKEPFQTCPMIDEVIDGLNEVDKIVHKFKNSEDPEVLRDCLSDIWTTYLLKGKWKIFEKTLLQFDLGAKNGNNLR